MKLLKPLLAAALVSSAFTVNMANAASMTYGTYVGIDYLKTSFVDLPIGEKKENPGYAIQFGYLFPSSGALVNGIELEYLNAGSAEYTFNVLGTGSGKVEMSGFNLSYKPKYYINRFYLSAQVGYAILEGKGKSSFTLGGQTYSEDFSKKIDSGLTFGGELGFDLTERLTMKGGYRVIEADTDALYAGIALRF
ncbi:outer membrane beta-barrel protein [Photobacterium chitinilyticum]|uniref:outer membrane beta-barrel protein n=1 Tax=Photobacterium chitinilyticum TaxID=2485123 RepID=UPI003D103CAE